MIGFIGCIIIGIIFSFTGYDVYVPGEGWNIKNSIILIILISIWLVIVNLMEIKK